MPKNKVKFKRVRKLMFIVVLVFVAVSAAFLFWPKSKGNNSVYLPRMGATPSSSPAPSVKPAATSPIAQNVPFTPQAPFGGWDDPRQQDGCEEASALMAVSWARGESFSLGQALDKILAISDFEQDKYNNFHDTSAADTVDRIFKAYFNFDGATVRKNATISNIISELEDGHLVVAPADGRLLGNPYFTPPGPERHMLVIIGYDYGTGEFITNDPGTKRGKSYRYDKNVLFNAIMDYPTGYHEPFSGMPKNVIVVKKI